jgi:proteasome lid subunit RPN8/RPN11
MDRAPLEACGVIVPDMDIPPEQWVHEMRNRAFSPTDSFVIDTKTIRQLITKAEQWRDVIVWHTHPGGNIGPSRGDLESKVEGVNYLVVTLPGGQAVRY